LKKKTRNPTTEAKRRESIQRKKNREGGEAQNMVRGKETVQRQGSRQSKTEERGIASTSVSGDQEEEDKVGEIPALRKKRKKTESSSRE